MNTPTPTPTPRTDSATYPADCLGKTLVTNRDCARALERELTALTAERDQLRAELTAEREKVRMLRSALEILCDEQNDAPLETRRDQWQLAMNEAGLALATTEDAK
jgi:hypothetical protein